MQANINTVRHSHWQHKHNDGKFGFFPTSLEVVRMEMELIDFSSVDPEMYIPICDFTGGEGDQLAFMYKYLSDMGLSPVAYYNEITEQRYLTAKERYGDLDNFHFANTDLFYLKCRNIEGKKYSRKTMAIIRNNPPYTWMEYFGQKIRSEDLFFRENEQYNIPGGIQIFELPIHQLIEQETLLKKICYRYKEINIFKFPQGEFEKFKQVVVIGVRKRENSNDIDIAEMWYEKVKAGSLQCIDEVTSPLYKLTNKVLKRAKPVDVFRDGRVTDKTLTNGLNTVLDNLIEKEKSKISIKLKGVQQNKMPIIEHLVGHQAVRVNAGEFDGIRNGVLIAGGSKKVIDVIEEKDGDTITTLEVERFVPFVEVTTKGGKIIVKDK